MKTIVKLCAASVIALSVGACYSATTSPYGYTIQGNGVVANGYHNGTVISNRQVLRAPAPRAVAAITATVHHHGRVDVSYPWWDAADPYQPWLSNYAPNLHESGGNGGNGNGHGASDSSSSNGNNGAY